MHRLRVLYLTNEDPRDKRSWSGIPFQVLNQLEKYFDVVTTGPIKDSKRILLIKALNRLSRRIFGKSYNTDHSRLIGRIKNSKIKSILNEPYDVVFSSSAREIFAINTTNPIIYFTDGTFDLVFNYYPEFSNLFKFSITESHVVERTAINKASLLLFSADWGAQSAIKRYNAKKDAIAITPFGANIKGIPNFSIDKKLGQEKFSMLFLAVDWYRKGGNIVYETFLLLKKQGCKVHLTICGCVPPFDLESSDVTVIPFLNKNDPSQFEVFEEMLFNTNLLFVPTRADCTPVVFSEAAAYGIPVLTTDTGGIPGIVENGVTGYCLQYDAKASDYAVIVKKLVADVDHYKSLCISSRQKFLDRLNWAHWGETVQTLIKKALRSKTENALPVENT